MQTTIPKTKRVPKTTKPVTTPAPPNNADTVSPDYAPELDDVYRQLNERDHIQKRPDIFVGSTDLHPYVRWVVSSDLPSTLQPTADPDPEHDPEAEADDDNDTATVTTTISKGSKASGAAGRISATQKRASIHIIQREIPYVAGLLKIFDEAISNARDHALRMTHSTKPDKHPVTYIHVDVDRESGWISIKNDGSGIDVAKHTELDIYYPELIFAHFRSSTNYDEERTFNTGAGKNGYGIKLTLVFSKEAVLETVDSTRGLKYVQHFHDGLSTIDTPTVTKVRTGSKPYTHIRFLPDYVRFGLPGGKLSAEMYALLHRRAIDMAGVCGPGLGMGEGAVAAAPASGGVTGGKGLTIQWNGDVVPIRDFQQYIHCYIGPPGKGGKARVYESPHPRWEYAVALSPTENFQHVSFVNGIATANGGAHVDYIVGQITAQLVKHIETKKKVKVSPASLKQQLILFLRCDVEYPSFDNQSKDRLVMPVDKFGSRCQVSPQFIEGVYKMGVADFALKMTNMREEKKSDGKKKKTIVGIPKYSPAEYAGTKKSSEAVLILTEGDSAKASVISGMSMEDRKCYGVFPLKGKVLNVRDEIESKVAKNEEITNLKKIMGLKTGFKYRTWEDVHSNMRYSKILILCDQDHDGSHIKGLLVNLFQSEWPELFQLSGFLAFMNTPILTATKGKTKLFFYNNGEFAKWKRELSAGSGGLHLWTIKYYKGLGTSTSAEFREYFANKKIVDFVYGGTSSDDVVDLVFRKKRANDRKDWMQRYDRDAFLDTSRPNVKYEEFFNNEMIHFSVYSCERALPNVMDGLKSSQRKILFCAFKRNLTKELKVAQFAGYVSEHACYHHGETSLCGAIVGMAQTFVGSNNINLLMPCGQFGTRNLGGNDAASPRYIFTHLSAITRALFPKEDDAVLRYLDDDGTVIEPEFYAPVIPTALINGCEGIGTGYSCSVPAFYPLDLVSAVRARLASSASPGVSRPDFSALPYYEGFIGKIECTGPGKYLTRGIYRREDEDTVFISELPIGTWTGYLYYKQKLEEMMTGKEDDKGERISPPVIKEYQMVESEVQVSIRIKFLSENQLNLLEQESHPNGVNGVEKLLQLTSSLSTRNMMMFDPASKLKCYSTVDDVIDDYFTVRLGLYVKRKAHLIRELNEVLRRASNRARFIQEIVAGSIDLRKYKNDAEIDALLEKMGLDRMSSTTGTDSDVNTDTTSDSSTSIMQGNYRYLTDMKLNTLTKERAERLLQERDQAAKELAVLQSTSPETMWNRDLDAFETQYREYREWRIKLQRPDGTPAAKNKARVPSKKTK
jgi:DNA topoisomerase-2